MGKKKLSLEFVRNSFNACGYNLLSEEYINSSQKLSYSCSNGHKNNISWDNWKQGHRCPLCRIIERSRNISGCNHYNWKGGVTGFNKELRNFIRSIGWCNKILKRDNYTCFMCGKRGGELVAHHIISLGFIKKYFNITSLYDAEKCSILYDIDNGLTLCVKCHKAHHRATGGLKNYEREG